MINAWKNWVIKYGVYTLFCRSFVKSFMVLKIVVCHLLKEKKSNKNVY